MKIYHRYQNEFIARWASNQVPLFQTISPTCSVLPKVDREGLPCSTLCRPNVVSDTICVHVCMYRAGDSRMYEGTGALSACTAAAACVRRTRYRIMQCSAEINARLHVNKLGPRSTWKVVRWHFCVDWCRLHVLRELTRCQIKLLYGRSART